PPRRPAVARIGQVALRGTPGPRPVVIVPSLINPPDVLDLPGRSLMAHLEGQGLNPLIIDWGESPEPLGLMALARERLQPLVEQLGQTPALVGYCLGGTLALALATQTPVSRLALIATPWHFAGYGDSQRAGLASWWASAAPLAEAMGQLPIDLLQPAFWSLDPAGLVAKYVRLAQASGDELADFVRLEDWANGGAPISLLAARDLAALYATGNWAGVDPAAITAPILDIIAGADRIVPPGAALSTLGIGTPLRLEAGHVGMVVGRRAPQLLWQQLVDWLTAPSPETLPMPAPGC
ncbi:alpha/beta fold hydrolase, partial [Sandarakinorhabdus oryzae]|uniref:alpha/beta fold hydrolase n=1 Tax=Sandarakinorhabdus oryzae TaxID=2675220 RepID=UPI0018CC6C06